MPNVEPMVQTAKMRAVEEDGIVKRVEDEKELKNKQIRTKTVMPKPETRRLDLKMALMKRGMSKSVEV